MLGLQGSKGSGVAKLPEGIGSQDHEALNVVARRVLLDALDALEDQRDAVTLVGAQAIYLRSVDVELGVAAYTSDADLGLDPALLQDVPLLEAAMGAAGFVLSEQPGSWLRGERVAGQIVNIAVDLLVAQSFSPGGESRRSGRIPPHDPKAMRRVLGLEAAAVDFDLMEVKSLEQGADARTIEARVAGVAALLVAKAFKIHERLESDRLTNKDAGDVVRLMKASDPEEVGERFGVLLGSERAADVTRTGLGHLRSLFRAPRTAGTNMAVEALAGGVEETTVRALPPAYLAALPSAIG